MKQFNKLLSFMSILLIFGACHLGKDLNKGESDTRAPSHREPLLKKYYSATKPYDASNPDPQLNDANMVVTDFVVHGDITVDGVLTNQKQRVNGAIYINKDDHERTLVVKDGTVLKHYAHDASSVTVWGKDSAGTIVYYRFQYGTEGLCKYKPLNGVLRYKGKSFIPDGSSLETYLEVIVYRDLKADKATYEISNQSTLPAQQENTGTPDAAPADPNDILQNTPGVEPNSSPQQNNPDFYQPPLKNFQPKEVPPKSSPMKRKT